MPELRHLHRLADAVRAARRGDAPQWLVEVNGRGVPVRAILLTVSIGFLSVILAAIWPDRCSCGCVNSSGAVALFCYLLIAISELRMRRRLEREEPERLTGEDVGLPVADVGRRSPPWSS